MPDSLKISERKYGMTPSMIPEFIQRRPSLPQTPALRAPKNISAVVSKESSNKTLTKSTANVPIKPTPKPVAKPASKPFNKTAIPIPKAPSPPVKISTNTTIPKPLVAVKPANATSQQNLSKNLNKKNSLPNLDTKTKKKPVQLKHDLSHVKPVQLKNGLNITRVESSKKHSSTSPIKIPQEVVARTSPVAAINTLRHKEAYKQVMLPRYVSPSKAVETAKHEEIVFPRYVSPSKVVEEPEVQEIVFPRYVSPSKVVEPTKHEEIVFPRYISPSIVNETTEPQEIVFPRYVSPSQKVEEVLEAQEIVFPRYISPSRVAEVEKTPKEIEKIEELALRRMPEPSLLRRPGFLGPRSPPSFFRPSPVAEVVEKVKPEPIVIETPTVSFSPIEFEEAEPEIIEEKVFANAPIFPRYVSKSAEVLEIEEPIKTKEVIFERNRPNFIVDPSFYRRPIPNGRRPAPFCANGPVKLVENIRPEPTLIDESTVSFLPVDFVEEIEQVITPEEIFAPPPVFPRYVPKKVINPENDDSTQENANFDNAAVNQSEDLNNAQPKNNIVIEETPESIIKSDYGRRTPFGKAPRYVSPEPIKIVKEPETTIETSEPSEIANETPEEMSQQFIKQSFVIPDLLPNEKVEIIEKPLIEVAPVQFEEIEFEIEELVYEANRFSAMPQLLRNRAPNSRYLKRTTPLNSAPRPYIRQQFADPLIQKVEQVIETPSEEATNIAIKESSIKLLPTEVIEEEVISEPSIPIIPRRIEFSEIRNPKPVLSSVTPNIIETEVTISKPVEIPYIPRKIDIPQNNILQPVAKVITDVVEEPKIDLPDLAVTEVDQREDVVLPKQMQIIPRAIQNSLLRAARPVLPRKSVIVEEPTVFTPEIIEEEVIASGSADIPFVPRKIEISRARNSVIEKIVEEPELMISEPNDTKEYVEVIPEAQKLSVETVAEEANPNPSSFPFNSFAQPRIPNIPRRPFRAPLEYRNVQSPYVRQVIQPEIRETVVEPVLVGVPPTVVEAPLISESKAAPQESATISKSDVVTDNTTPPPTQALISQKLRR